jgi:putative addiction module component (TIGR02574 family)
MRLRFPARRDRWYNKNMNERVKKLSEEIRKLTAEEQAELMDELLSLTYREPDPEIERAWAEEAERRLEAYERGDTQAVSAEEVMVRLRSRFARES